MRSAFASAPRVPLESLRFKVGGALADESSLYVHREADRLLSQALVRGEFAYVLAPRQIGKSSLQARTRRMLQQQGYRCVTLDLEGFGLRESTEANGYFDILAEIAAQLRLPYPDRFWERHGLLSPVQRFLRYVRDEVLVRPERPVALFLDEVEEVFPHAPQLRDDFFAAVRYLYNARATDPAYKALIICLTGVASPLDLIRDAARTPFNVGVGIALSDFSRREMDELAPGFAGLDADVPALLDAVHRWTAGQPYMTQKVCSAVLGVEGGVAPGREVEVVRRVVEEQFFRQGTYALAEPHLAHAARYFDKVASDPRVARMLTLYKRLLLGGDLPYSRQDPVQLDLRLTGLAVERARPSGGGLCIGVRNPIFARVFDEAWIHQQEEQRPLTGLRERWQEGGRSARDLPKGPALRELLRQLEAAELTPEEREFLLVARLQADQAHFRTRLLVTVAVLCLSAMGVGLVLERSKREALSRSAALYQQEAERRLRAEQREAKLRVDSERRIQEEESLRYWEQVQKDEAELRRRTEEAEKRAYQAQLLAAKLRVEEKDQRLREEARGRAQATARSRDLEEDAEVKQQRIVTLLGQAERAERDLQAARQRLVDVEGALSEARGELAQALPLRRRYAAALANGLWAVAGSKGGRAPVAALQGLLEATRALPGGARRLVQELRQPGPVARLLVQGRTLWVAGLEGPVRRYGLPEGRDLGEAGEGNGAEVLAAAGPLLVTRDPADLLRLRAWDARSPGLSRALSGHRGPVLSAALSADGAWLASCGSDLSVRLWSRGADGGVVMHRALFGFRAPPRMVDFAAGAGRVVAAGADGAARVYSTDGRMVALLPGDRPLRAARLAQGGERALTLAEDGVARLWDVRGAALLQRWRAGQVRAEGAAEALLLPDGRGALTLSSDGVARLWEAGSGVERRQLGTAVRALALGPGGTSALVAGDEGVQLWDVAGGGSVALLLPGLPAGVRVVGAALAGEVAVVVGDDQGVRLYPATLRGAVRALCAELAGRPECRVSEGCDLAALQRAGVCG